MDSLQSSPRSPEAKRKPGGGKQPLYIRLYFRRHMTELVQLLGYRNALSGRNQTATRGT